MFQAPMAGRLWSVHSSKRGTRSGTAALGPGRAYSEVAAVFDDVIRTARGPRRARRACYVAGSSLALAALVVLVIWAGGWSSAGVAFDPFLPVRIVSAAPAQGRSEPLSNPRAAGQEPRLTPSPEPARARSRVATIAPPRGASRRLEDAEGGRPAGEEVEAGSGSGMGSGPGPGSDIGEPAAYPGAGWRRPEQAQRACVQESVRIPHDLRGFVSGPVTVRFAIGRDGAPSAFEVLGVVPDARIGGAIWQAILSCCWISGADAQGRPMKIWVTMPLRFVSG
jgi:protein TonB